MRVVLDPGDLDRLRYQWKRLQLALHGDKEHIPDRKEARLIHGRINDILDNRRRGTRRPDGSVFWAEPANPWLTDQLDFMQEKTEENISINATGQAEVVDTPKETS